MSNEGSVELFDHMRIVKDQIELSAAAIHNQLDGMADRLIRVESDQTEMHTKVLAIYNKLRAVEAVGEDMTTTGGTAHCYDNRAVGQVSGSANLSVDLPALQSVIANLNEDRYALRDEINRLRNGLRALLFNMSTDKDGDWFICKEAKAVVDTAWELVGGS